MAANQRAVTVTTTATRLDPETEATSHDGSYAAIYNNGSVTVYIGFTSSVTTSNGFPLAAGASMSFEFGYSGDALYGIVASGTADVRVLEGDV
jgi:hypothetical protein